MDIAKRKHYTCFVDVKGHVLEKPFPVIQSQQGFEQLYQRILEAMNELGKNEIIIPIELTGHNWLNLAYFLQEKGIPLVIANPAHVRRSKELDDNLPTKQRCQRYDGDREAGERLGDLATPEFFTTSKPICASGARFGRNS